MNLDLLYELLGYAASVLIAVSMMMRRVVRLRVINLIGAGVFSLYGILIGSIPVVLLNVAIVFINIHNLLAMHRTREFFQLLQVEHDNPYLEQFLRFYASCIRQSQPTFDFSPQPNWLSVFILRDMVPAGLLIGIRTGSNRLRICLDFAIPSYRDFKIAEFLFSRRMDFFIDQDVRWIEAPRGDPAHNRYLVRIGFREASDRSGLLELDLAGWVDRKR